MKYLIIALALITSTVQATTCRTDSFNTTRCDNGTTYRTDSFGTTRGSDGSTYRTDSFGTTRDNNGNSWRTDSFGTTRGSNGDVTRTDALEPAGQHTATAAQRRAAATRLVRFAVTEGECNYPFNKKVIVANYGEEGKSNLARMK